MEANASGGGPAAILDVDGTLIDSNYHHALAWYRAFRGHALILPLWQIHRHLGMGGDHGGFGEQELRDAGAADVFESIPELIAGNRSHPALRDARPLGNRRTREGWRLAIAADARLLGVGPHGLRRRRSPPENWRPRARP